MTTRADAADEDLEPGTSAPMAAHGLALSPSPFGLDSLLSGMRFKGDWRDYQSRILEEMEDHLSNGRLHVVAAPGAGKTILGLEIIRRLGRRAVVFAPTVAIRDQWAQRLVPLFLDRPPGAEQVSHQLSDPRELTLVTYQALDALGRTENIDQLARQLDHAGPITLVLDEAHHLRREWWNSIDQLARSLADARIISLTATPPYDATFAEWTRYESLCGPIDLEIGIPELVRNGDLCPHQDHLVLSSPSAETLQLLDARRRAIWDIQRDLWADDSLLDLLEDHPWVRSSDEHVEAILEAPEMLSSVLVLLASAGRKPPAGPLRILGVSPRELPPTSFLWLERFLNGVTATHTGIFNLGSERLKALRGRLHRHGLIEGGKVRLGETRSIFQLMASSLAKLDSVVEIAQAEDRALGEALRMVVLSDHIRAGELPAASQAEFRPTKSGVVPIFERLRRAGVASGSLGVLTGALVIVPRSALPALQAFVSSHGAAVDLRAFDMPACPDHVRVELAGPGGARLVQFVTNLFTCGEIRILVGTQSLLGEGWDAPALNSLILASNTASFMLSNQMRGRAIRIEDGNPQKVANIWHLATLEPPTKGLIGEAAEHLNWGELGDAQPAGLADLALLQRRFRAFEGISNGDSTLIESGMGRLGLDLTQGFQRVNARTFASATDRPAIAQRWASSLGGGETRARVRETAAPNYAPQVLAWSDTLQALGWSALSSGVFAAADELRGVDSFENISTLVMTLSGAAALASLPKLAKAARLIWRNGSIEGCLEQVGYVVLKTLAHAGLASSAEADLGRFTVCSSVDGQKDIVLRGVSRSTERLVMQAIAEVLGPVQNSRYLLLRSSRLGWRTRTDYHAVPSVLGAKREWAETFARLWNARVGSSKLVFARTPEGRKVLLRARAKSLAAGFQRSVDRRSAWL